MYCMSRCVIYCHGIKGFVQDCDISSALAMEIPQFCTCHCHTYGPHVDMGWKAKEAWLQHKNNQCLGLKVLTVVIMQIELIFTKHNINAFNSLRPSDAYMRQWNKPSFLLRIAHYLLGAQPLSEPMLVYCQLEPKEQTSLKFLSKFKHFH